MNQRQALAVVNIEIAVIAEVHVREDGLGLLLGGLVIAPRAVEVVDGSECQRDVTAEFFALGAEQHVLQNLRLTLLQPLRLDHQQPADRSDGE